MSVYCTVWNIFLELVFNHPIAGYLGWDTGYTGILKFHPSADPHVSDLVTCLDTLLAEIIPDRLVKAEKVKDT